MIMTIHDALASLHPTSKWIIRGDVLEWCDGDIPAPTQSEIDVEIERLQSEYDAQAYARKRKPEYPDIGDQLDALLKHLNYRRTQGDELVQELDDIIAAWLNVKQRYPK